MEVKSNYYVLALGYGIEINELGQVVKTFKLIAPNYVRRQNLTVDMTIFQMQFKNYLSQYEYQHQSVVFIN